MECGEASGVSEMNNNAGVKGMEGEDSKTTMALKSLGESMECGERSAEEDSSEGELVSEEDGRSTSRSTVSLSSEVSEEEKMRRQLREDNLKKHRMIRTKGGLKYEVDITEEDIKSLKHQLDEYKHTHIGVKVVEASLIPSARNANNESNRTARFCPRLCSWPRS